MRIILPIKLTFVFIFIFPDNVKLPDIKAEDLRTGNLSTFLSPTRPNVPLGELKIPEPVTGSTLGNIDVTNPANAFSLGLNPTDMAIAQRRRGTQ